MSFNLKQLYRRFRAWQLHPAAVPHSDEPHHCYNCGLEFTGRFCPDCGQRATAGRITWDVVRQSVMDVWGLGGRSLPYSLWHLLWRPGYFISDYINGKRQSSFPPVKMLVLVALILFLVGKAIFPEYWGLILDDGSESIKTTGWEYYFDYSIQWIGGHLEWTFLLAFSLLIIPTWFIFRYSPRNTRHTMPQGFFIQVFLTIVYLIWMFIIFLFVKMANMNLGYDVGSNGFENVLFESLFFLIIAIVLVNYKQLFGYGWWGTVWRVLLATFTALLEFLVLYLLIKILSGFNVTAAGIHGTNFKLSMLLLLFIIFNGLLLAVADVINRKLWRERGWLRAMVLPSLFVVLLIAMGIFLESLF